MENPKFIVHLQCDQLIFLVFSSNNNINTLLLNEIASLDGYNIPYRIDTCPACGTRLIQNSCILWSEKDNINTTYKQIKAQALHRFTLQMEKYIIDSLLTIPLYKDK